MFHDFIQRFKNYFSVREYLRPSDWVNQLDLSRDISAALDKIDLSLTPYLKAPLDEWDFTGVIREVTIVAIEQTGKSSTWIWGLIWTFLFKPCLSIVCYKNDQDATEANRDKLLPLMQSVPELAMELARPNSKARDHYHFSNLISYFMGSGSRVTSKSAKIRVGDEVDDWTKYAGRVSNLKDLRKRARFFNESIFYKVCSATTSGGAIWKEFLESSQGYWFLKCQNHKCPSQHWKLHTGLTMRSADIHNLQFETVEDERGIKRPVAGSARLVCPVCHHEHVEAQKRTMNLEGDYIHERPELIGKHSGYQWGALASQSQVFGWDNLAAEQLKAGRSANIEDQMYFDNSIRGLPYVQRKITGDIEEKLRQHCPAAPVDPATLEAIFLSIDTQDHGWKWELRGLDVNSNRHLLAYGLCEYLELTPEEREAINAQRRAAADMAGEPFAPVVTIDDLINTPWNGIDVMLAIIDEGGHRKREVYPFVQTQNKLYSYKGDNRGASRIRPSENLPKLFLVHEKEYQADLLYYLYSQRNTENNYWYLLPIEQISDTYIQELAAMKADDGKRDGHLFENWDHQGRVHDYFDTGKMYLVIEELAISSFPLESFRHGKAEILHANDDAPSDAEATANKAAEAANIPNSNAGSWMHGGNSGWMR